MTLTLTPAQLAELTHDLQAYFTLSQDVLDLETRENKALCGHSPYQPSEFIQARKSLLPRLKQAFILLQSWRQTWQRVSPEQRVSCAEVKTLFQAIQGVLMRVLLLDRENQQALLRRGLVPAEHLPQAAVERPNFVASVYRRHSGC
jgi:hypothetical protein